jgi:hypothetical protein
MSDKVKFKPYYLRNRGVRTNTMVSSDLTSGSQLKSIYQYNNAFGRMNSLMPYIYIYMDRKKQ